MRLDARFVRLDAAWSTEEALEVLAMDRIEQVVVHRLDGDGREYFYAYRIGPVTQALVSRPGATVFEALDLHEYKASPTAGALSGTQPGTVVIADGQIAGVVTAAVGGTRGPGVLGPARDSRALRASLPAEIVKGDVTSLVIEILANPADDAAAAVFQAKTGDVLDIVVQVRGGLALAGANTFQVTLDDTDLSRQVKVRGTALGEGSAKVMVFKDGVGIGVVAVSVRILDASDSTETREAHAELHPPVAIPDLSVLIFEDRAAQTYTMRISNRDLRLYNSQQFGPIKLEGDVEGYFAQLFDRVDAILASSDPPQAKADAFEAIGTNLMKKIMPDDLRMALWSLRGQIETIMIQSEEPWVPWEMCRLFGPDASGKIVEDGFLAEKFIVTRWFLATPCQTDLRISKIALVAPPDSGLLAANAEAQFIRGLASPPARTVTAVNATALDLRNALADGDFDTLHFTGHGLANTGNADRANIRLAQNRWFTPEDVCGRVASFGERHPVVVLNACQVGRAGKSLGGIAGWPQAFIRSGAAAFIGAFWSISDGQASVFTQELYTHLLAGDSIGKAVHAARAAIRNGLDPTWLAYVVYAHPDAQVTP